jgi:succinyl-diaminopimelate desuccinylase
MPTLEPEHALLQGLIRCPSVTPAEGGALNLLEGLLAAAGFTCHRLPFGKGKSQVDNLFAHYGEGDRHLGFAGHIDVVPPGDHAAWRHDPFSGVIDNGFIYGRGAVDMKGGIAAFVTAAINWVKGSKTEGRISLIITGDEEGEAVNGTGPMLKWIADAGLMPDAVLLGEPTSSDTMGDIIKHGRRGSFSGEIEVHGSQGHTAYPHLATNPLPVLMAMLEPLTAGVIDDGNVHFDPSTTAITSIDTGNPARNVIPASARATFNIRYTSDHTAEKLRSWLTDHFNSISKDWKANWIDSAHPFITTPGDFTDLISAAITTITGRCPVLSTSGGTSDARFISQYTDVVEFGLVGTTMHKVDERTPLEDVTTLQQIYAQVIKIYFGGMEQK